MMYNHGVSREGDLVDLALAEKMVDQVGRLVQLRRDSHGPGPGERQAVLAG